MADERLTTISFTDEIVEYFKNDNTKLSASEIWFYYTTDSELVAKEYFSDQHHQVPSTSGFWTRYMCHPSAIRTCLVFLSAIEALCFVQATRSISKDSGATAIVSIGSRPRKEQVIQLKKRFPNAKFHLIFGNDIICRVLDCAVALWLTDKEAIFKLAESSIRISYGQSVRLVETTKLSWSSFQKAFGIRTSVRTHKPPKKFRSFKDMLIRQNS